MLCLFVIKLGMVQFGEGRSSRVRWGGLHCIKEEPSGVVRAGWQRHGGLLLVLIVAHGMLAGKR